LGGGFDVLSDLIEVGRGLSSLGGKVYNGEEEGGSVSGADYRTDHSGRSGDGGVRGRIDCCTVGGERLYSTIGVIEERDPTTSYAVPTLGGGAWEMEGRPAMWKSGWGIAGFHKGVEEGGSRKGGVSLRVADQGLPGGE
jgi:hypothetical protein